MWPPEITKRGIGRSLSEHLVLPIIHGEPRLCSEEAKQDCTQFISLPLRVVKTGQKPASVLPEVGPAVCSVYASVINCSWFNICSRLEFHLYSAHLCLPLSVCIYISRKAACISLPFFSPRMTDTVTMTVD